MPSGPRLRLSFVALLCAFCGHAFAGVPSAILDLALDPLVINTNPGPKHFDEQRVTHLFVPTDKGATWTRRGGVVIPQSNFDEHTFVELKNGPLDRRTGRAPMTAFLSDDGKSWKGGFVFEERNGVSYPDGFQSHDGVIQILYDRERAKKREILMALVTEADVSAGKLVSPGSRTKMLVSKTLGQRKPEASPAPVVNNSTRNP